MSHSLLLVDDEPNVPKSIKRALRSQNYSIHIAHSGAQALELLESQPVDVIVSDHRMPGMSGSELLTTVSEKYPSIVSIMLSGQADMNAVIDAVNDGNIYKFLHKPWSNEALRSTVADAFEVSESRSESETSSVLTQQQFCTQISAEHLNCNSALMVLEVRNANELRSEIDSDHYRDSITDRIEAHCCATFGEPTVALQELEGNLFAAVFKELNGESTERFFLALANEFDLNAHTVPAIAIGYSALGSDATTNFNEALSALTATKSAGLATKYSNQIGKNLHLRKSLEEDMRLGLERGEFYLELQPQVACLDGKIRGAESLCRWEHPNKGKISPEMFIDLAEHTGFINQLGLWIIEQGCKSLTSLQENGQEDVRLSINVSPRQFSQRGWVDAVLDFLERNSIDAKFLELEITESSIMSDTGHALEVISELRSKGVRIAMDDFGTGHSSLGQINQLPIDVLKIDRSLIIGIEDCSKRSTLLRNLLSLAKDLGLETIAEGVETRGQAEMCTQFGCDLIQGYYYYKPMRIEQFIQL
ncbi:MAG: EAL domain-containing protein [Pseudomonadales bacterium]